MKPEARMLKYKNFGKKSLDEIVEKLKKLKLSLGMNFSESMTSAIEMEAKKLNPAVAVEGEEKKEVQKATEQVQEGTEEPEEEVKQEQPQEKKVKKEKKEKKVKVVKPSKKAKQGKKEKK